MIPSFHIQSQELLFSPTTVNIKYNICLLKTRHKNSKKSKPGN